MLIRDFTYRLSVITIPKKMRFIRGSFYSYIQFFIARDWLKITIYYLQQSCFKPWVSQFYWRHQFSKKKFQWTHIDFRFIWLILHVYQTNAWSFVWVNLTQCTDWRLKTLHNLFWKHMNKTWSPHRNTILCIFVTFRFDLHKSLGEFGRVWLNSLFCLNFYFLNARNLKFAFLEIGDLQSSFCSLLWFEFFISFSTKNRFCRVWLLVGMHPN